MGEARKGKIARLPRKLRDEVCQRINDGQSGSAICAWLNADKSVLKILAEHFDGEPVNEQNLSAWRTGGYQDWLHDQTRVTHIKDLADSSRRIAEASGGNLSEGACVIAAGKIQELLEGLTDEQLPEIIDALVGLRKMELATKGEKNDRVKLQQSEQALKQKDREIRLRENQAAGNVLKACEDQRAQKIAASDVSHTEKIAQMRELIFGKD